MSDATDTLNTKVSATPTTKSTINDDRSSGFDRTVLLLSGGFIAVFVTLALIDNTLLAHIVNVGFSWSINLFGPYWQFLLLATFLISLGLAIAKTGQVRLGNLSKPEMDSFRWLSVIICTLLAGGGVFWAAAEPIAHFVNPPPIFAQTSNVHQLAINALSQSFMHWGFLAWAILGSLTSIVLMHLHFDKGLPLKPRTLLYPLLGERALKGMTGAFIDATSIIAVAAGTIGPIGFLGLQVSYALNALFAFPDTYTTQFIIILFAIAMYTISALTGMNKGLQFLSRCNVILAVILMIYILIFGDTNFIIKGYLEGVGSMLNNFIPMATYRNDGSWLSAWTLFFWGWFLGYGPIMAIFIARVSRGRTIRQLICAISIVAPLITCFWFTVVGGTGLAFEIAHPGSVSQAFSGFNLPASLLAITQQLPYPTLISILFLLLTAIFIITTGDSMTYTISVVISGKNNPSTAIRAFWGVMMGVSAMILISLGSGGISALQSFIVITAVPVSLILLPSLWNAPQLAIKMAQEQGILVKKRQATD